MVWSPADSGCLSFPRVACPHLSLNSLYWRLSLPMVKEVIWSSPPPCYWIKCNSNEPILGCYAANLGVTFSLQDKLVGAMMGIEYASVKGWTNLWLECDSQLVVTAFKNPSIVPWRLRNRWSNCLVMIKKLWISMFPICIGKVTLVLIDWRPIGPPFRDLFGGIQFQFSLGRSFSVIDLIFFPIG